VTQVIVDEDDPGFKNPSKPVGEFFDDGQIGAIRQDNPDWTLVQDAGRGWRRVVPSPEPREIVEKEVVIALLRSGYHVVTVGGGGIPVVRANHGLEGIDAVIDKDLASSLLANQLGVGLFIISTEVEEVALNFGKPNQQAINKMTLREAEEYVKEGHFAPGSMLPKIDAALRFLRGGGREVIITSPERLKEAVVSGRGTHIVP
jgi:carbamate kinase